jgi:hypothetical protein
MLNRPIRPSSLLMCGFPNRLCVFHLGRVSETPTSGISVLKETVVDCGLYFVNGIVTDCFISAP